MKRRRKDDIRINIAAWTVVIFWLIGVYTIAYQMGCMITKFSVRVSNKLASKNDKLDMLEDEGGEH